MKITIEDGEDKQVFTDVTDAFVTLLWMKPTKMKRGGQMAFIQENYHHSWGQNIREIVKELSQSQKELQDILTTIQHGSDTNPTE